MHGARPVRATRRLLLSGVTIVAFAASAVSLVACGDGASEGAPASAPAQVASAAEPEPGAGPAGTIILQLTGLGFFAVDARHPGAAPAATTWRTPAQEFFVTSADGKRSAFVQSDRDGGVSLFVGEGSSTALLARIAEPGDPVLVQGKGEAASVGGVPLVMAWSPDGRHIAFGTLTLPYALAIAGQDSSGGWTVSHYAITGGYAGELAWAPDGSFLAISTYTQDRKNHTVLMLAKGAEVALRLIDGCHITWSPDSRYIAVHRDPTPAPGAWIISSDGSERLPISDDPRAFPLAWRF